MRGQMMDMPLLVSSLIAHADRNHGDVEIVSRTIEGPDKDGAGAVHRTTYAQAHARARRLAQALGRLGVKQGDRVGTLAWNGYRHFEIYYGVSGMGAVMHTINPRLFPEQLAFIVNHAEDKYVFFDLTFVALVEKLAPACKSVKGWVAMTDRAHAPRIDLPNLLCYEELLEREDGDYDWPVLDE
jgi:fatty-acyl-CoA synthase